MDHLPYFESFGTKAIHAGQEPEKWTSWAVTPPISLATTFKQPEPGVTKDKYEYSRGGNPTRECLEEAFAAICNGKKAFVWASGLAGTQAVLQLLRGGDHVLAIDDLYGGTNRLLRRLAEPMGITADFVSTADADEFVKAMTPKTKIVWIESPTNPLLQITDIRKIAKKVKEYNKDCILVVDNTFMSSYLQRPLDLGADIEFASVTKYYNGHSDVLMGLTVCKNDDIIEKLQFIQFAAGAVPSPFDCYLVNRGLKTLHLRMEAHSKNAMAVASFLEAHPKVRSVNYPGLKSHPHHEIATRQCTGFSGMVTFRIKGGLEESKKFLQSCKVFTLAESLGAVESLAELPCIMTHASVPAKQRIELGITDDLIRLSVGVEDTLDLLKDVDQALHVSVAGRVRCPDPHDFVHIDATHWVKRDAVKQAHLQSSATRNESHVFDGANKKVMTSSSSSTTTPSKVRTTTTATTEAKDQEDKVFASSPSRPRTARQPPGGFTTFTLG
eukprot:m.16453 g.16453  ORF g.16453 m.16453 type:complete len:498 (+) comp8002_c0_seq1:55-1548(+)